MENKINTVSIDNDYTKIKSYKDACACLGVKERDFAGIEKDEVAYIKLKTIAKAFRGGKDISINSKRTVYYPWFYYYNSGDKIEIDDLIYMSDSEKNGTTSFRGFSSINAFDGYKDGYLIVRSHASISPVNLGTHLHVFDKDTAVYFGKQFLALWRDYLLN